MTTSNTKCLRVHKWAGNAANPTYSRYYYVPEDWTLDECLRWLQRQN